MKTVPQITVSEILTRTLHEVMMDFVCGGNNRKLGIMKKSVIISGYYINVANASRSQSASIIIDTDNNFS